MVQVFATSATLHGAMEVNRANQVFAREDLGWKLEHLISAVNQIQTHVSTLQVVVSGIVSSMSTVAGASAFLLTASATGIGSITDLDAMSVPSISSFRTSWNGWGVAMGESLVTKYLFFNAAVGSNAAASGVESSALDLQVNNMQIESFFYQASSLASTADLKCEFALSLDGTTFGSYADESDVLESSKDVTNPHGLHFVPIAAPLAPFAKLKLTGVTSNPTDTTVTAGVILRKSW